MKNKFLLFLIGNLLFVLCLIFSKKIIAQDMSSNNYKLQWGNFNMTSGKKSSSSYSLTDTAGQNFAANFASTGYSVKAGFQNIYSTVSVTNELALSIDDLSIELGSLNSGVASTASNIVTVVSSPSLGYQFLASENHPLQVNSTIQIPNTSCNIGSTCTTSHSATWSNTTDYGFGFNAIGVSGTVVTGIGTSDYFSDATQYRPFADLSQNQTPQVFMSENATTTNHSAKITYKAVINPLQPNGTYENSIIYTLVGKY